MANRTQVGVASVKGTNPQFLFDAIVRQKVYASRYWKEDCMGLTAETLVDEAIKLTYIGGTYGGVLKPTRFLILVLKMLQIQPDHDVVIELIRNTDYKYVTALAMFYWRLVAQQEDVFRQLEPYYNDYRKIIYRKLDGRYKLMYLDEFVAELLTQEISCEISLPRMQKRMILEELERLPPRVSLLEEQLAQEEVNAEEQAPEDAARSAAHSPAAQSQSASRSRSRSSSRERKKKHKKEKKHKKTDEWRKIVKGKKKQKSDD